MGLHAKSPDPGRLPLRWEKQTNHATVERPGHGELGPRREGTRGARDGAGPAGCPRGGAGTVLQVASGRTDLEGVDRATARNPSSEDGPSKSTEGRRWRADSRKCPAGGQPGLFEFVRRDRDRRAVGACPRPRRRSHVPPGLRCPGGRTGCEGIRWDWGVRFMALILRSVKV